MQIHYSSVSTASMLNLFSPLTFCRTRLRNRIVLTALPSGYAAPHGFMNSDLADYYLTRAQSGLGMLVIEQTHILAPSDDTLPHLGLYADAHVTDLRQCVSAARRAGPCPREFANNR